jgi:arylsulfatase A-like enzyme
VDTFDPHEPWDPPAHYLALYERDYRGESVIYPRYDRCDYLSAEELAHCRALFAGEVSLVDRWVGHLVDTIDRLGLRETTAVFFLADHGFYLGEHGYIGKSLITPEYQQSLPLYPEVAAIPLLARVPGLAPRTSDVLAQPVDLYPTVAELCGVPSAALPAAVGGRSLLKAIAGQVAGRQHRAVAVSAPTLSHPGLRVPHPTNRASITDGDWLLVFGSQVHQVADAETTAMVDSVLRSVRTLEQGRIRPEVYHLGSDPGCTRNLWGRAEPGAERAARELHQAFVEELERCGVPEHHLRFFRQLPDET